MINARVDQNSKTVYVDVSGYITNEEANSFLAKHKQMTKGLRKSQYKLVVTPSKFECENDNDIKSVCIALYKGGYRHIYGRSKRIYNEYSITKFYGAKNVYKSS